MKALKFFLYALTMIAMISVTASCDNDTQAEEAAEEAAEDMSEAFRTEREELRADLRETRNEINEKIAEMREDLDDASEEAKAEMQQKIAKLEQWGQSIDQDMNRLEASAEAGWADLKANVRSSLQRIENEWDEMF